MPAIKVSKGSSVHIGRGYISGSDVGIEVDATSSVTADNLTFDNVRQPWDLAGPAPSRITGTRITNDPKVREAKAFSSVGWSRPHGPPLPAFCPQCKAVFPSRNYNIGSSRFYSRDNEEVCINCGYEHAKLSDGLFDLTSEAIRVLGAPDFTHAMLATIAALSADVVSERVSGEEAVARFAAVSPKLGALARSALRIGKAALLYLAAAAALYATVLQKQALTVAEEQLRLQQESNASSDQAIEHTLKALSELKFTLEEQGKTKDQAGRSGTSASETPTETGSVKLQSQRAPKLRERRRKAEAERRKALNPRHPLPPPRP